MSTPFIVYVTEINKGHAYFDTKEEAEAFANSDDRDWDYVKWTDSELSEITVEPSDA